MSGADLFRPRRRPLLRVILTFAAAAIILLTTGIVVWLRINVVPPDCSDPRTLALVRASLLNRFKLPAGVTMENIRTLAGGYVAFRFSCQATLDNIDRTALPPGTPIPGFVYYISRLTPDHQRHVVTVRIEPLLIMERVE